jgi:hypothetical protein
MNATDLHEVGPEYRVLAAGSAASPEDILDATRHFGSLPAGYIDLVKKVTELELEHAGGQYIRIWGPAGCVEMDEAYDIRRRMPGTVPVGDDGGRVIFYGEGPCGIGLYYVGWGVLDTNESVWIANDLRSLLLHAEGLSNF